MPGVVSVAKTFEMAEDWDQASRLFEVPSDRIVKRVPHCSPVPSGFAATVSTYVGDTETWFETGSSTVRVSVTFTEFIERIYSVRNRESVFWFLDCHPKIVPVLIEMYVQVQCRFPDSELFLELVSDPEDLLDHQIVVQVSTDKGAAEALEALSRFDEEYWLDVVGEIGEFVCVNLEFR